MAHATSNRDMFTFTVIGTPKNANGVTVYTTVIIWTDDKAKAKVVMVTEEKILEALRQIEE